MKGALPERCPTLTKAAYEVDYLPISLVVAGIPTAAQAQFAIPIELPRLGINLRQELSGRTITTCGICANHAEELLDENSLWHQHGERASPS